MKRFFIALVFLLPFYSQAQDTPQAKEATSQTKEASKVQDTPQAKKTTSQTKEASQAQETTSQTQNAFYISGLLGYTHLDGENFSFRKDTIRLNSSALRLGVLFNDHYSLGLHVQPNEGASAQHSGLNQRALDFRFTFLSLMAEFDYYVNKAGEDGFWFGGLVGATRVKREYPAPTSIHPDNEDFKEFFVDNKTHYELSVGASCGYQFMMTSHFSIAPQITYILTIPNQFRDSFSQFSGMVNFTYWVHL